MTSHCDTPTYEQNSMVYRPNFVSLGKKRTSPKSLYISHFISTWNSRGFEFGAVLFLASAYPGTLMPLSIYALVRAAAAIAFSPWLGRYIDTSERLAAIRTSIIGQRVPVALSCLSFLLLLSDYLTHWSLLKHAIFGLLVLLACAEKLCAVMNTVSVERDWVVVIAGDDENFLQSMNSQMRRIDLFCKLISPLAIALVDGFSSEVAIWLTLSVNVSCAGVEYLLIARVYRQTPALSRQQPGPASDRTIAEDEVSSPSATTQNEPTEQTQPELTFSSWLGTSSLNAYFHSSAFLPSLSLSILYLTVLSFSGQMTTYLLSVPSPHLNGTSVGVLRTISTVFELSSTFFAPKLISSIGAVRAGIWCLSWQVICLTPGVGFLFSTSVVPLSRLFIKDDSASQPTGPVGVIVLVIAVMLSRIGLWSFDLVAQLLIQNSIESRNRGSFSSIEASLQNFFELCTFAMTIVWSKPEQFRYPALVSVISVWFAAGFYAKFVRDRRGHLIHLPSCLDINLGSRFKSNHNRSLYSSVQAQDDTEDIELSDEHLQTIAHA